MRLVVVAWNDWDYEFVGQRCECLYPFEQDAATNLVGAEILRVESNSGLSRAGGYGVSAYDSESSVWHNCAAGKAIRSGKLAFETLSPGQAKAMGRSARGIFALAIEDRGVAIGAMHLVVSQEGSKVTLSPELAKALPLWGALLMKSAGFEKTALRQDQPDASDLTSRQVSILELMADGKTNAEFAKALLLSESTIRQETVRIYRALGVNKRDLAAKQAIGLGIISKPKRVPPTAMEIGSQI